MSMNTYLQGRLRNTPLPRSHGLYPLFEAVVNSIQALAAGGRDSTTGEIVVEINRTPQHSLAFDAFAQGPGVPLNEPIAGFLVADNGCGFDDKNLESFETLDSDYKASEGCRGVGRLLWLKAFDSVRIWSDFKANDGTLMRRSFYFTAAKGVEGMVVEPSPDQAHPLTRVLLKGFGAEYRDRSPKTARAIANALFEHCLWYFVRDGGAPSIQVRDGTEVIFLENVYEEYMFSSAQKRSFNVKDATFEITHLKLKTSESRRPFLAWCAAGRVVKEESLVGKLPGLHGRIADENGDFVYAAYMTAPFLDRNVRPERIGFDIEESNDDMFSRTELSMTDIRDAALDSAAQFLAPYLLASKAAGRERVEQFVAHKAPRYRPILKRIHDDKLSVNPDISDKDLELLLYKQLSELEGSLLAEGHAIMNFTGEDTTIQYRAKLGEYLAKADDLKKSDLANYVFHRKIILDILQRAVEKGSDGRYAREELIHEIIMPLRTTSNEARLDSCNLWLLDERLAFHDFLASDKSLSSVPIVENGDGKEPDILALNIFDEPLLVSDGQRLPLASIVVIEIKRPMRNDAAAGEDKDPIEQALGYLDRVRQGQAKTASGRPIPRSDEIPGFCYVICDITPSVERRCKLAMLKVTSDRQGYFGYNENYRAYIEVASYDRLLNGARERNRAFFDKLGLPTN